MDIPQISTMCGEALLAHFRLEIEASEIENLPVDQICLIDELVVGDVRIHDRERILRLGIRFLETALDDCESCDYSGTKNEVDCPNINTLGFIRDTLSK